MSVEPDTLAPPPFGVSHVASSTPPRADWSASTVQADVLRPLNGGGARSLVRAPGRLDVMGGIAADTGALVVQLTTEDHACVAVALRDDQSIVIHEATSGASQGSPLTLSLDRLADEAVRSKSGAPLVGFDGVGAPMLCVVGTLVEMLAGGAVAGFDKGVTVSFGSTLGGLCDAGGEAALASATMVGVAHAMRATLEAESAERVCVRVGARWSAQPIGATTASCCLVGKPHELMQLQFDPCVVVGTVPIPDELMFLGLDVGESSAEAYSKYKRARTASFMGRLLVDRIIRHDGTSHVMWDGCLSRLSISDYVERFRDRMPTKIRGSEFLERFGETGDPETTIDPDTIYKVRSRTEHHVYEHTRVCQFVECLSRAARSCDERAYVEAGELMYASHWSYGQRCGLGGLDSDRLVSLIRKRGTGHDVYGARVAGRGCGGHVVVCVRASDRAAAAIENALADFTVQTGRTVRRIRGSAAGAMVGGVREV